MTEFCIHIHPNRARDLDLAQVRALCAALARERDLVRRHAVLEGLDHVPYVNLMFETERPDLLWSLIEQRLYRDGAVGGALRASSMAMCQGTRGWDDYRLLHHYDPAVPACNHSPAA